MVCINNGLYRDSVVMFPAPLCRGIQISFGISDLDGNSVKGPMQPERGLPGFRDTVKASAACHNAVSLLDSPGKHKTDKIASHVSSKT